jgi:hypothetical protein
MNSIVDPTQPGEGSALLEVSEAVKKSGRYDVWSAQASARLDDGVKVKVCPRASHQTKYCFAYFPRANSSYCI